MTNLQLVSCLMLCAVTMCTVYPDAVNDKDKRAYASTQERIAVMERTCSYVKRGHAIPTIRRDNAICDNFAKEIAREADKQLALKQ